MTTLERAARALGKSVIMRSEARDADDPYVAEWVEAMLPTMLEDVRAVLTAIREPSEDDMTKVYREGAWNCSLGEVGAIHTAIIDAALAEEGR